MKIQEQKFGVEIELKNIKRITAAEIIAKYFATSSCYIGTVYKTYAATDRDGRVWKAMRDSSINDIDDRQCEIVTPILVYKDIEDLLNIVRLLCEAGAEADPSCGIHVHVDGANHTPESLTRLLNFAIGRQDLFYEALEIKGRANRWCRKISPKLLAALKHDAEKTKNSTERIWYSPVNDGYEYGINHEHYNPTRYHGINLHSFFTKGTVEFRLFNGTTDADKIKAYIQFCLAMSAWAINADNKMYYKSCSDYTSEQKGALMMRVLTKRLRMVGSEFKTTRQCLTNAFTRPVAA